MRKLLSIALAVMLVATLLPVLPVAADGATATSFTMSNGWLNNDGGTATLSGNTLTMVKDASGAFTYLFYLDSMKNDTSDQDYTINFNAVVSSDRHYANNWDSYEIGFMRMGGDWGTQGFIAIDSNGYDTEQRLYSSFGGSDVQSGFTQEAHNYSIITNRGTGKYSVYVDGVAVITDASFDMGEYINNFNIAVKNGNSGATNATLTLTDMVIYQGAYVPAAATPEPTAAPIDYTQNYPVAAASGIGYGGYIYKNRNTTESGSEYTIGAGDGELYIWSDPFRSSYGTTEIVIPFTATADGHSSFGYMDGSHNTVRLYTFPEGTNDYKFALVPGGTNGWAYYLYENNQLVDSGDWTASNDWWNIRFDVNNSNSNTLTVDLGAKTAYTVDSWAPIPTPTAEPATAEPTAAPATKIRDINVTDPYKNGNDGTFNTTEFPGVLTMIKDKTGSNFNAILWSDTEDARTDTISWVFDARISDWEGYVNTWDGYAFSLRRDGGDREVVRICPNATGVSITRGAGADVITTVEGTGYHAYSVVYNKANDTLQVYVDGTKVIDDTLNFSNYTQHGFLVKNGKNEASGCTARFGAMETWAGEHIRTAPTLTWVDPTEAPTEAPAVAPTVSMEAKGAANGDNAFYYVISVALNNGTAEAFTVKHYPADRDEAVAKTQNFNISNISGVTAKLVSVLKDIPAAQADRDITTKATLTYTLGGNSASVGAENTTSLNATK